MDTERTKVLDRIKKLLVMAERGTEGEAANAAAMAQRLLMQYNVTPDEIGDVDDSIDPTAGRIDREVVDQHSKRVHWRGNLVFALAKANCCDAWWSSVRTTVCGKPHNRAIVKSLFDYLIATIERLCQEEMQKEKRRYKEYLAQIQPLLDEGIISPFQINTEPNWRDWGRSFRYGMSDRLVERIQDEMNQMRRNGIRDDETGTVTVSALAVQDAFKKATREIEIWKAENGIRLGTSRGSSARATRDGYTAGSKAGANVGLNRQMGAGASGRALKGTR